MTAGSRSIGVFRIGDRYFGLRNACPHQSGPLCHGDVVQWLEAPGPGQYRVRGDRRMVSCPWHGWEYDLQTGQSWFDPERNRVRSYAVGVEPGSELCVDADVIVAGEPTPGPYVAETFDVRVEGDYVVLYLDRRAQRADPDLETEV